jgi:hypothetical protein
MSRNSRIAFLPVAFFVFAAGFHFSAAVAEAKEKKEKKESPEDIEAKQHFKKGVDLFEKGKYAEAMDEFQRSYYLKPHWALKYNIGLCYLKLGYEAEGVMELSLYIETGGKDIKSSARKEVDAILADLLPELGTIVIFGDLKDVTVEVDGKKKPGPTSKGELYVRHGTLDLVIYRKDNIILKKIVTIEKGEIIEIDLPKDVPAPPPVQTTTKSAGGEKGEQEGAITLSDFPEPEEKGVKKGKETAPEAKEAGKERGEKKMVPMLWVWVTLGIAGGTLATGTTMGFLAVKERNDMKSDEDAYRLSPSSDLMNSRNDHYDKGSAYAMASTVLLSVGAAAGVATIVLYVLSGQKAKAKVKVEKEGHEGGVKDKGKDKKKEKAAVFFMPQLAGGTFTVIY